jgi:hypothetical protein
VIAVTHLTRDRDRREDRGWLVRHGWFVVGTVLFVLASVAFVRGLGNAGDNARALRQWTERSRRSVQDFRPRRLPVVYDWLAFVGLLGGIAAVGIGAWRRRDRRSRATFHIGSAPGVDLATDDAPLPDFPLVVPADEGFAVCFTDRMDGEAALGSHIGSLVDAVRARQALPSARVSGAFELPLGVDGRVRVRCGRSAFVVTAGAPPHGQTGAPLARIESRTLAFGAGSALVHLGFLGLLHSIPPDGKSLAGDVFGAGPDRMISARLVGYEDPVAKLERDSAPATEGDPGAGAEGGREAGAEGKMGTPQSTHATGRFRIARRADEPQLAHREAVAQARQAGFLHVFGAYRASDPFATLTGSSWQSSGMSDRDVYGGMIGDEYRDMQGGWGTGVDDDGPGGGGDRFATIGTGDYDTIGDGTPGPGPLTHWDRPPGKTTPRQPKGPIVTIGPVDSPEYDRALIRREIKKQLGRIRHCYERELIARRDLEGTVTTVFVINPVGAVISVRAAGMGNDEVESCVAGVIKSVQFPKPPGGGLHKVTYPFIFHRPGS